MRRVCVSVNLYFLPLIPSVVGSQTSETPTGLKQVKKLDKCSKYGKTNQLVFIFSESHTSPSCVLDTGEFSEDTVSSRANITAAQQLKQHAV